MKNVLRKITVIALSFSICAAGTAVMQSVSPRSDYAIVASAAEKVTALWPVGGGAENRYISSHFNDPRGSGIHRAIDIPAPEGTDIYAVLDGKVVFAGRLEDNDNSCGNTVILYHSSIGMYTVYCHASRLCVSEGQKVSQGTVIAKVGNTGYSFGNHLDFKVCPRLAGGSMPWPRDHVDPEAYFHFVYELPEPKPVFESKYEELMFDADFYAAKYPDLKKAFGSDSDKLLEHWFNYGIKEGRAASIFFDPKYYLEQNPDLKSAFGTDYTKAHKHFLQYGYKEYRKLSPVFDVKFYRSNYSNLSSLNSAQLIDHFKQYGVNEGRQASEVFDPNKYRSRYDDLNKAYGSTWRMYYRHYLLWGKSEGRTAYFSSVYEESMFDAYFYYRNNKDLQKAYGYDPDKLCQHWLKYGIKEGRTASIMFDPKYYLEQNPDLKKAFKNDYAAAHKHFLQYGCKEYRKLSPVFDVQFYRSSHNDLRSMYSVQLIEHFYRYGIKEGRKASAEFDPVRYRNKYSDLNKAYGSNMKLYYEHYMLTGISEKRNCK